MSEEQIKSLKELCKQGCTDSDIEDWCEEHGVPEKQAFHQVAVWLAPKCCQGCMYIDFYDSAHPCNSCCRNKQDYYRRSEE